MDFKLVLISIPAWMSEYSKAPTGCIHRVKITVMAQCSLAEYKALIQGLRSLVTETLYTCLEWAALYVNHSLQS